MHLEQAIRSKTAAGLKGVAWRTLLRWIGFGELKATKIGQTYLIDPADLRDFMARYPELSKGGRPRKCKNQPNGGPKRD